MRKPSSLYGKTSFNCRGADFSAEHFASLDESELREIYRWRTSPEVAKWMYTGNFSLESHLAFAGTLARREDCFYWLVKDSAGTPAGVIYLTGIDGDSAELGLYAAPGVRSAGRVLMAGITHFAFGVLGIKELRAEVYESNRPARKLYEACGMTLSRPARETQRGTGENVCVYILPSPEKGIKK